MQVVLKRLTETLGFSDAIEIVRRWGGRELYVPVTVGPYDPLTLTLGGDLAKRLVEHWGGQRLALPAERNALLDMRNEAIVAAVDSGASHQDVAIQYGLRRQSVGHIVRAYKEREAVRKKFAVSSACPA